MSVIFAMGGWVAQMGDGWLSLGDERSKWWEWVAQMIEPQTAVAEVPGSNPASTQVEVIQH